MFYWKMCSIFIFLRFVDCYPITKIQHLLQVLIAIKEDQKALHCHL